MRMVSAESVILLVSLLATCEVANGSTWSWQSQDSLIYLPGIDTAEVFPGGLVVENFPAKQEMWVQSPGRGYILEKKMATDSSILTWEIPWTEESGGPKSMGSQKELDRT